MPTVGILTARTISEPISHRLKRTQPGSRFSVLGAGCAQVQGRVLGNKVLSHHAARGSPGVLVEKNRNMT